MTVIDRKTVLREGMVAAQKNEGNNWKEKAFSAKKSPKSSRILARSFYNELRTNGFSRNEILAVSSEMLGLVTHDIKERNFQ